MTDRGAYRHLLSPLWIRNATLSNRVVFGPSLTAVKLAKLGARVRIVTKWPMIGWKRRRKYIFTGY